ncbi:MAG TPA: hypothetical protein VHM70_12490 [Polyangiaceae bacterium]|nr:hypothetical protein [Polyangiaceae bacterium]
MAFEWRAGSLLRGLQGRILNAVLSVPYSARSTLAVASFSLGLAACSGAAPGAPDDGQRSASQGATQSAAVGQSAEPKAAELGSSVLVDARISVSRTEVVSSAEPTLDALAQAAGVAQSGAITQPAAIAQSAAIAQFAHLDEGSKDTLAAAGLAVEPPRVGQCGVPAQGALAEGRTGSFTALGEIRLLDVGEVTITPLDAAGADLVDNAAGELRANKSVSLAPHAFPSVSGFVSGVVYTSRDRLPQGLPSGTDYEIAVAGGAELAGFRLNAQAPQQPAQITVNGEPLAQVAQIPTDVPLDTTWAVGATGDIIVVELNAVADARGTEPGSDADSTRVVRCAFSDETGVGSIPVEWLSGLSGSGHLTLHRYRAQETLRSVPELPPSLIRVSFDFEASRAVDFGR